MGFYQVGMAYFKKSENVLGNISQRLAYVQKEPLEIQTLYAIPLLKLDDDDTIR